MHIHDADWQQAFSFAQRLDCAGVEKQFAVELEMVRQPLLAGVERLGFGDEQGADGFATCQTRHDVRFTPAGNDGVRAAAGGAFGRDDFGDHAAFAVLCSCAAGHGFERWIAGTGFGDQRGAGVLTRIGREQPLLVGEDMVPVCCPEMLNGKTQIEPGELEQLPLLHQSARPDAWREWFEVAGLTNVNAMGGARYELFAMLVEAARAGLGVALVPRFFVLSELASGELLTPCPHILHSQRNYYLVYPENNAGSVPLQVFCKWLRDEAAVYREEG